MGTNVKQDRHWVKYLSTVVVALVMTFIVCLAKDIFNVEEPEMVLRILCDAFFVPGIVLFCFGLLTVCNKSGTFDGLGYTFKAMGRVFRNYRNDESQPKTYYDYKESVKGKHKIAWHFLIVGGAVTIIGVILTIIHANLF